MLAALYAVVLGTDTLEMSTGGGGDLVYDDATVSTLSTSKRWAPDYMYQPMGVLPLPTPQYAKAYRRHLVSMEGMVVKDLIHYFPELAEGVQPRARSKDPMGPLQALHSNMQRQSEENGMLNDFRDRLEALSDRIDRCTSMIRAGGDRVAPAAPRGNRICTALKCVGVLALLTGMALSAPIQYNHLTRDRSPPHRSSNVPHMDSPTTFPSGMPSLSPTLGTPTLNPSGTPSGSPSGRPSGRPSGAPSGIPTVQPSRSPSGRPSFAPVTGFPTLVPTVTPTVEKQSPAPTQVSTKPEEQPPTTEFKGSVAPTQTNTKAEELPPN